VVKKRLTTKDAKVNTKEHEGRRSPEGNSKSVTLSYLKNMNKSIPVLRLLFLATCLSITGLSSAQKYLTGDSCKAYIIQLSFEKEPLLPENYEELSRYNFFGICWNGKPDDNLRFAKQMGYEYVMYQKGMENSSLAENLHFYLESPDYQVYSSLGIDRTLSLKKDYSPQQKETYQKYFALKNNSATFPDNMASGWFSGDGFSVEPDWQQKRVIDYFVQQITADSRNKEKPSKNFLFGGVAWDVPQLTGDFYGGGKQITLATWNGEDCSGLFPGNRHEFKTYSEGKARYYLALKDALKREYPGRRLNFIFEPYNFYDSWFKGIGNLDHNDQLKLMEDAMITEECGRTKWATGTEFVDDKRVFDTGLITRNNTGSTTPDNHDLASNKIIAGKAGINGSWFGWYGRFSGSGDRVPMKNIYEVPSWLQLIRVVANWDNLNDIPLADRKWDGTAYISTNSRIDDNIIYSRQPKTHKLFVVFLNGKGELKLNSGEKIVSISRVDSYFCEAGDGSKDLKVKGRKVILSK
jgi:hypothetical protein